MPYPTPTPVGDIVPHLLRQLTVHINDAVAAASAAAAAAAVAAAAGGTGTGTGTAGGGDARDARDLESDAAESDVETDADESDVDGARHFTSAVNDRFH